MESPKERRYLPEQKGWHQIEYLAAFSNGESDALPSPTKEELRKEHSNNCITPWRSYTAACMTVGFACASPCVAFSCLSPPLWAVGVLSVTGGIFGGIANFAAWFCANNQSRADNARQDAALDAQTIYFGVAVDLLDLYHSEPRDPHAPDEVEIDKFSQVAEGIIRCRPHIEESLKRHFDKREIERILSPLMEACEYVRSGGEYTPTDEFLKIKIEQLETRGTLKKGERTIEDLIGRLLVLEARLTASPAEIE